MSSSIQSIGRLVHGRDDAGREIGTFLILPMERLIKYLKVDRIKSYKDITPKLFNEAVALAGQDLNSWNFSVYNAYYGTAETDMEKVIDAMNTAIAEKTNTVVTIGVDVSNIS